MSLVKNGGDAPYATLLDILQTLFALERIMICREIRSLGLQSTLDAILTRAHIEARFTEGMSWDSRVEWHIDHKIP